MLKLLREDEVAPEFRRFTENTEKAFIAVPFWGNGAIKLLGLGRGKKISVVCNLGSNACNPYVIADLKKLKGVSLRTHPRLHAKIYASDTFSIIGSSNASTNGLAVEGDTLNGWVEANVLSDDPNLMQNAIDLFNEIWTSRETELVTSLALKKAKNAWDRPKPQPPTAPLSGTLLVACRAHPELFHSVFVAHYDNSLTPKAKQLLGQVQKNARADPSIGASNFKNAWGHQFNELILPGSWLVNIDCKKNGGPRFSGCSQVPQPSLRMKVSGETDLTLSIPGSVKLNGNSKSFRISSSEKTELEAHAIRMLRKNRLVSLSEAIRIIDR